MLLGIPPNWSERRAHLAGSLGAALARRCLDLRRVRPVGEERTLALTAHRLRVLRTWFGIDWKGAELPKVFAAGDEV
jgi:hypothetical protein